MSHNIFGQRFISVREPAWHKLGTVVQEDMSAEDAIKAAGLDFSYELLPISATLPDGSTVELDKMALMRSPTTDDNTWRQFGIVSDSYAVLPNETLAKGLDALADVSGWSFETAGALDQGQRVFMTLSTGERSIKNDEYKSYVVVTDSKGTGESLQILLAPTRVVCQNTLIMAKNSSLLNIRLRHNATLAADYDFWVKMIHKLENQQNQMYSRLDHFAERKLTKDEFDDFKSAVFPLPEDNGKIDRLKSLGLESNPALDKLIESMEYHTTHSLAHQKALATVYESFNDSAENTTTNNSAFAGTAYAALQAATEIADWGGRDSKTATQSALFGSRSAIKRRAWSAVDELV